ncbi:MAG TPA: DinB family protein [Pyrinomonadaceae bacterium]|nr:DinB family protein [Pyrinomonadaceae bacterium]
MTDKWRHLFSDGEFARREQILSGLSFGQVTARASTQSHTIYEELWHANRWQSIIVNRDESLYAEWERGAVYPESAPASEEEWDSLVKEFLAGTEKALWWTESPERLAHETDPGSTMADALHSLAVHSAYHMGKIVALRQQLGAWENTAVK